jgi:Tfp pilus assembly protein PilF
MRGARVRQCAAIAVALLAFSFAISSCSGGSPTSSTSHTTTTGGTANPILTRAVSELNHGDVALAVANFLEVVKTQPSNHIAWYDLGVIAAKAGQNTQAVNDYLSSLSGDKTYVPALYNLAILETGSHPQTAVELYLKALKIEPGDADAHLNIGFLYETMGNQAAGEEQIAKAVQLDPSLNARVPKSALSSS